MISVPHRVLSTRVSKNKIDTLEVLCLKQGTIKRYRVFTTFDDEPGESSWDLDPIDFDSVNDEDLYRYLAESFWLLRIGLSEVQRACDLIDKKIFLTPVGASNELSISEMGSLGVVLIEIFNRIQTIDTSDDSSWEVLGYLNDNLSMIESLPTLPNSVQSSLHGCRLAYREISGEVELNRSRRRIGKG